MPKIRIEFEFTVEKEIEVTEEELGALKNGGYNDLYNLVTNNNILYYAKEDSDINALYFTEIIK